MNKAEKPRSLCGLFHAHASFLFSWLFRSRSLARSGQRSLFWLPLRTPELLLLQLFQLCRVAFGNADIRNHAAVFLFRVWHTSDTTPTRSRSIKSHFEIRVRLRHPFLIRSSSLCAQNREIARIGNNTFESEPLAKLITQSEITLQKSIFHRFFYVMFSRRSHASWWHQYKTIIQREWRVELPLIFQLGNRAVQHAVRRSAVPRCLHRAVHRADVPQSPSGSGSECVKDV